MRKKPFYGSKLIYGLILLSFLSFTGGSCDQQLKYITLTPGNPTISTPGVATAVMPGVVNVTASLGAVSGSAPLTVSSATLQSITITPLNPTVPNGITLTFTATGNYSDGTSRDVTSIVAWGSTSANVATVNAIGQGTAASTGSGTTNITAALGAVAGSTLLTVSAITLSSITVAGSTTLPGGLTQQFSATGNYLGGSSYDITSLAAWSSSSTSVASVSSTGFVTTASVGVTSSSTISTSFSGTSNSATLTVTPATLQSITVSSPSSSTVPNGRSVQFSATGTYSDSTTHDLTSLVTWSVGTPTVAFVNNFGLATAIGPANTTSTVTATMGAVSGGATLTVSTAALQSVTITPAGPTLPIGATQRFTAAANYSDGTNYDVSSLVTWSTGVATNPVATMFTGMVQQFRAMGIYNGGTTDISSLAVWSSGNPAVANVFTSGFALAFGSGTTLITATLDGISASTTLAVSPAVAMKSITITPANLTLARGASQQFTATGGYFDGSSNTLTTFVTWNSDNPAAAVVDIFGVVTGVAGGTANISAALGSFSGITTLTVSP